MARKPRYRLRYTFWLNHLNKDEETVADTIERLKTERSFATVVRDGIMIVAELRQGRVDLLLRLYPWVADIIKQSTPTPPSAPDSGDLERLITSSVKAAMLELPTIPAPPAGYPMMKAPVSEAQGAAPLAAVKAAALADASTIADNFLDFIQ